MKDLRDLKDLTIHCTKSGVSVGRGAVGGGSSMILIQGTLHPEP